MLRHQQFIRSLALTGMAVAALIAPHAASAMPASDPQHVLQAQHVLVDLRTPDAVTPFVKPEDEDRPAYARHPGARPADADEDRPAHRPTPRCPSSRRRRRSARRSRSRAPATTTSTSAPPRSEPASRCCSPSRPPGRRSRSTASALTRSRAKPTDGRSSPARRPNGRPANGGPPVVGGTARTRRSGSCRSARGGTARAAGPAVG